MFKGKLRKAASVFLCVSMVATLQVPTIAFADEDSGEGSAAGSTESVSSSYTPQNIAGLYATGDFEATGDSESSVVLSTDATSNSLLISGDREDVLDTVFTIKKSFDFDEGTVGRFMVAGNAAKGKKVVLEFYLDDDTDPFYTTQLDPQDDASTWENPSVACGDVVSEEIEGEHSLSIRVEQCSVDPSFSLQYVEFCEASVPVVNIDIDESLGTVEAMNSSEDHTANCYGTVEIDVPEGCESCMGTDQDEFVSTDGALDLEYIRGRGNSTWDAAKKPYKFKLEKSKNLLGMGKNKHWALMANAYDPSMMRNIMSSLIGMETGMDYTPSMEPVELIMDGEYYGCYMLAEVTRVDKSRVDITDQDADNANASDITGGYLLSLGNWTLDADKLNFTTNKAKGVIQIESPDTYSKTDSAQYDYIKNYVQSVENAIYSHDTDTYSSLMDLTEAAKYYWIEELSKNGDGYTSGSCYLYKDKDGGVHDGKLCWGPLWDFDLAWAAMDTSVDTANDWCHKNSFWNLELFKDHSYAALVQALWPTYKAALENVIKDGGTLDTLYERMWIAAGYDYEKWQGNTEGEELEEESASAANPFSVLKGNMEELRTWLKTRITWVDENLSSLENTPTTITYKVSGKVYKKIQEYVGTPFANIPTAPAKKGYTFIGWTYTYTEYLRDVLDATLLTEAEYRELLIDAGLTAAEADAKIAKLKKGVAKTATLEEDTEVTAGMVLTAKYMKSSLIPTITKIYTSRNTYYGIYSTTDPTCIEIDYQVVPFSAEDTLNDVSLTSSNPNVVTTTAHSEYLNVTGPGDATVTLKSVQGATKTIKVHVYTEDQYYNVEKPDDESIYLAANTVYVKKGSYAQIPFGGLYKGMVEYTEPELHAINDSVVQIGRCGVVYGAALGTTTVCLVNAITGTFSTCKVVVTDGKTHIGDIVKRKGLAYKVTSAVKGARTVSCLGPVSKKLKTATTLNYVKIKGLKYKVTKVAAGAFKGCTKLRKMVLGTNIQIVGANAFKNCRALRKVIIRSQLKPKFYGGAFKNVGKKAVFWVHKSQKKYFKIVLSGRKVCGY